MLEPEAQVTPLPLAEAPAVPAFTPRAVCYRCEKPQSMCVCAQLSQVDNRTGVLVLQHPRERTHPIGTARLARLGLRNVRVEVAWNATVREDQPPDWLPPDTALLYPAPGAPELGALPPGQRPRHLLVLDGTWHTAHSLYRDKAWLQRMPHVCLQPSEASRYRLRKQPAAQCISTIEAIVQALCLLEPDTRGLASLIDAFDAMIEAQLVHVRRRLGRQGQRKRRPAAQRRIPAALVRDLRDLVVVYTESARTWAGERALLQLTACALGTGGLLQHQLRCSPQPASDKLFGYMRLQPRDFDAAISLPALRASWQQFLGEHTGNPMVAAWNDSTLQLLRAAGLEVPASLCLKSAYRGRCGREHATLEAVVAAEQLTTRPNDLCGRAAQRISDAVAIAQHLHALQHAAVPDAPASR